VIEGIVTNSQNDQRFWMPSVDITEEDDKLTISAELPGIDKNDVKINLHDHVLTIEGERSHLKENKPDGCLCKERHYGKFSRSFTLPSKVNADKIEADYKDGILTISLPKIEETKPRQITIK
jgi:HSP20 family protein